jgi:hypothetical protein
MSQTQTVLQRWDTPVSDAVSLAMVSLVDRDGLHLTLQDLRDPNRRRYCFSFQKVVAYRNILEEFRDGEQWIRQGTGRTFRATESEWLRELRSREALLDVMAPGCQHYLVVTEDDVIDVLSPHEPEIREVAAAPIEESLPGKSRILYNSMDRPEIEQVISDLTKTRKPDV